MRSVWVSDDRRRRRPSHVVVVSAPHGARRPERDGPDVVTPIPGAREVRAALDIDAIEAPVRIPRERYTSPQFAALERERLWPKVWVVACSSDHVAAPGDWYEMRCGTLSVVIVRDHEGVLHAFQNVCRHRGNTLCEGSGSGLAEFRCRYHNW